MTAFQFSDIKEVDTLHQLALQSGGSDEGEPVFASVRRWLLRAYVRDPDGNKLAFVVYPHRVGL
ncbi:VOC family protein [Sphingopyxis terrae]|uniref:hypothetical protein n=1 Tax=Sphingopyxis terrae TaxID=33052 RepID=UPI00363FB30C